MQMLPGAWLRTRGGSSIVTGALALACLLFPSFAGAVAGPPGGELSARLAQLAKPSVRSLPPGRQASALGLPRRGPGSLLRQGDRVLVEVRFDRGAAAAVPALRAAGGRTLNVSRRYQTVTMAVGPTDLQALSDVARVEWVKEVLTPLQFASDCPSGKVVSEGVGQMHAGEAEEEARKEFEVDGTGVTVGILSDSMNKATEAIGGGPIATTEEVDVEAGDLPGASNTCPSQATPVNILSQFEPEPPEEEEATDEGRGMAQIVHDVAPGANIAFASAFSGGLTGFAENIEKLAEPEASEGAEAKVIADDVSYFEEPFFQEGPVAVAVSRATEEGATYFSAAGNDNLLDGSGRDIGSWEAPAFRDSGGCPAPLVALSEAVEIEEEELEEAEEEEFPGIGLNAHHCMDFDPSQGVDDTFGVTVEEGETLIADLQWAEPWFGVNTDIDAYLFDSEGALIGFSFEDNIFGSKAPFEILGGENEALGDQELQLVINRYQGASPRLKFDLLQNGSGVSAIEYPESRGGDIVGPTIFGHNGAADTVSVGAIPFNSTEEPEGYSSHGPVTHYFGPVDVEEPFEAAEPLPSPETLSKPDVVATDCGVTTFFAFEPKSEPGVWRFCGTSAAAPHAAAVAALALQAEPEAEPADIHHAEIESAQPVGSFGSCAVGGGLVDAVGTIEVLRGEREGSPLDPCTPPDSPPIPMPPKPTPKAAIQPSPPDTIIRRHPRKVVRTGGRSAKVTFRFASDQDGVTFLCKVDRGVFRPCAAKLVRFFGLGKHVVKAKAQDAAGSIDATPAAFRFRVKQRHPHF